jgi:hypothetical protein
MYQHSDPAPQRRVLPTFHSAPRTFVLLTIAITLIFCSIGTYWLGGLTLIVPDGYQGMLAIQYACPGGYAVNAASTVERRVVFDSRGVACVQERYQDLFPRAGRRIRSAHTTRGQPIRVVQELNRDSTQGSTITITSPFTRMETIQGDVHEVTLFWVGERHTFDEIVDHGFFATVESKFLKERFDFPKRR